MPTLYRRHRAACKHGTDHYWRRCSCPIWIEGTVEGKYVRRGLKTTSWERAEELERELIRNAEIKEPPPPTPDIAEAITKFLADAVGRNLSKGTVKKYRVLLSQLKKFTTSKGIFELSQISVDIARQFRLTWADGPISSTKKIERFRAFCRFCVTAGWMKANSAKEVTMPTTKTPPTLPMSDKEITDALKHADEPRWHALILVLRWSGLRISDAMQLTADKLDGNRLFLRTEKTGTDVFVPLPDFVVDQLKSLPLHGGYFFWRRAGESQLETATGNARRALRKIFKAAGIEGGHPHRFRDSFALGLLKNNVSIETVSILLGHADSKITTKHYRPWIAELQQNLESAVAKTWPKPQIAA